jgi:transaldolase
MKYFLDSAKIDEIREAYSTFGIDGVTTNPNHIMNSGKPFYTVIAELAAFVKENGLEGYEKFPVSVEINPHLDDVDEMIAMARKISGMCENFVIKIPCTASGITAARALEKEGIRTNLTLVFSASQAIIAAKNGSLFVSPFIGWKEQSGEDCAAYIADIVDIYKNYGYYGNTQIICAAVRTGKQIVDCAVAGADIVTAGLQVYKDSMYHPFTDLGLSRFQNSWDKTVTTE